MGISFRGLTKGAYQWALLMFIRIQDYIGPADPNFQNFEVRTKFCPFARAFCSPLRVLFRRARTKFTIILRSNGRAIVVAVVRPTTEVLLPCAEI